MLMMTSQILKSAGFTKTQKPRYLENETLFFLNKKIHSLHIKHYFKPKNNFVVEVTFILFFFSCNNISTLVTYLRIKLLHCLLCISNMYVFHLFLTVLIKYNMASSNNLTFLTNNVEGLQSS